MARHSHKFTIADDDAVRALVEKLTDGGRHQERREKLLRALDDAILHYKDSNQKVRQAFFHGYRCKKLKGKLNGITSLRKK